MPVSVFDLFSIGVGPSSSHTVGPMRAAARFSSAVQQMGALDRTSQIHVDLYGSLAATGNGHGTLTAVAIGLEGIYPEDVEPAALEESLDRIRQSGKLNLAGSHPISFAIERIVLRPLTLLARHTNGMKFTAVDLSGNTLLEETYFSIGGGFIVREGEDEAIEKSGSLPLPFPYSSAVELLNHCTTTGVRISEIMLTNELVHRDENEIRSGLLKIHAVMEDCIKRSITRQGSLPGGLNVRRRAKTWFDKLSLEDPDFDPFFAPDWVNLMAMAVNEENASGGRVVTAPTNGAAGIIPAVLYYATTYIPKIAKATQTDRNDAIVRFLLTAGAIGVLYKERASISGAEVGCQGEVGSAASMAAAGLAELLGGTPQQVENAAEIAMEHNLGLTCDPIGGLVQVPCIERNAIAANKAINAARMALRGDGQHHVTLDQVIETMRQTGMDMSDKYKETAMGGLAVNVPLC
ncbi:L-serine ammonia-lyase [Arthrobacter sp. StoSoilA2]|uniref:L-serine ammonia-lyase n=1 Tax=Arthrobacter sp. StoSoilA2 TaxID=2830990 RepID=UPI001CC3F9B4|nr:L-serine ammonia-lyase [Arthrobacter sp. StoSoilA2]BCW35995.1 L-serine ammonia-lyase [Arthrobacter sp. StoSoilA2]